MRWILACILALGFAGRGGFACLWDRDTLAEEASGAIELVGVITGRFPRNPPAYYAARLARVAVELERDPSNLDLYDDAAVACDRLHRSDEAIEWMRRKAEVLPRTGATEHRYRYHANLGTFLVHAWLRDGAAPEDPRGAASVEHLRSAIEINPEAHFGRESVQLRTIEWLLEERAEPAAGRLDEPRFGNILEMGNPMFTQPGPDTGRTLDGLTGLVALGAAWESVDVFEAISLLLAQQQRASMAYVAGLRVQELLAAGRASWSPHFPLPHENVGANALERHGHLDRWYREARAAADAWQGARSAYIERLVAVGKHPDTHADFWDGFDDEQHPRPAMPNVAVLPASGIETLVFACFCVGIAVGVLLLWRHVRRARAKVRPHP